MRASGKRAARRAEKRAEERSQLARQAVDDMYTQVAEEWLSEFGDLTPLQKRFLEQALSNYQHFAKEDSSDPQILFAKLQAQERVGIIQARLGEHESADATFRLLLCEASELSDRFADRAVFRFMRVNAGVRLEHLCREAGRARMPKDYCTRPMHKRTLPAIWCCRE